MAKKDQHPKKLSKQDIHDKFFMYSLTKLHCEKVAEKEAIARVGRKINLGYR